METFNLTQHKKFYRSFAENNPDVAIQDVNITRADELKKLNKNKQYGEGEFKEMLAIRQRVSRLTSNVKVQEALIKNKIHSAQQVVQLTKRQFANTYTDPLGVSREEANNIYDNASAITEKVRHMSANISTSIASPAYNALKATNVGTDAKEYFQNLPSYQELFGSLDYCECDECKSIFGPAAYFVDLMRIIDKYVTTPNKTTIPSGLTLSDRRPDLDQIVLSCNNTNHLVPYIQIVIERLTALVISQLSTTEAKLPKQLATTVNYPFNTPFNQPLVSIRVLLEQVGLSLDNIYNLIGVDVAAIARERLGIGPVQNTILTAAASGDQLDAYYGFPDGTDLTTVLNNVGIFQQRANVTSGEVYKLLNQDLSTAEQTAKLAHNFFINQGYSDEAYLNIKADSSPQVFENPTEDVFDRLNRFIRLSQFFSLTYTELDWLLRISSGTTSVSIDASSEENLAGILSLASNFNLGIIQIAALFGPLKTYGEGSGDTSASQFDTIYNNPAILKGNSPYHPKDNPLNSIYTDNYKTWTPGSTSNTSIISYLSGALNLKIQELNALGEAIFGISSTNLTVENLSTLYRHSLLAQMFEMDIAQYLKLLSFSGITLNAVFSVDDVNSLQAYVELMNQAGYTVYDLDYFINNTSSSYTQPLYQDDTVQDWLTTLWVGNIPGDDKKEAYTAGAMANYLGTSENMILAISSIFTQAISLPHDITHWWDAFLAIPAKPSDPSAYKTYINKVLSLSSRWLVIINKLSIPYQEVNSIGSYPASYGFDADHMDTYNYQQVADIYTFKTYFSTYADPQYHLLQYVSAVNASDANAIDKLVAVTSWNAGETTALVPLVAKGETNLVTQIHQLAAGINVLNTLHADTNYLSSLKKLSTADPNTDWSTYTSLDTQTQKQIQSIYATDQWEGVFNQINGKIDLQLRDALLAIALWKLSEIYNGITTPENVYEFMLIDVEMGDITQISYVKEALNACQLYLQRVRLKLEQGIDVLDIPEIWWEWIMQYRYWEDNRLIYVYPENYLLPSIRHTKTQLFENLENNLQQSPITDAYVEQAYTEYINDFATLAKLTPVESLDTLIEDPEKGQIRNLYVIARSQTQPYTFYIASQEEGYPWTEWSEIKVTINSSYVTPVFAFNRLYIFWIELNKSVGSSITTSGGQDTKSNNSVTFKVDVKCSFQDLLGKWVNPQIIKQNEVVYYTITDDNNPTSSDLPFEGLFEMNSLPWLKLQAIPFNNTNLSPLEQKGQSFEALCLQYGPYLDDSTTPLTITKTIDPVTDDQIFDDLLYHSGQNFNRQLQSYQSGRLPLLTSIILNTDLKPSFLYRRNEYYYIDTYVPNKQSIPYQALSNSLNNSLEIIYSTDVIYDNYWGEYAAGVPSNSSNNQLSPSSFTSDSISKSTSQNIFNALKTAGVLDSGGNIVLSKLVSLDLSDVLNGLLGTAKSDVHPNQYGEIQKTLFLHAASVNLLGTIESAKSEVKAVQNRPGSFIFSSSEETFLFQPQEVGEHQAFSSLGESTVVRRTRNDGSTFMQMGITYKQSMAIITQLKSFSFLDDEGYLKKTDDLRSNLKFIIQTLITNKQIPDTVKYQSVYFILMGFPIAYEDIFINSVIDSDQSKEIYQAFAAYFLIDPFGRVDLDNLTGANANLVLGNLLLQEKISYKQVSGIYETLFYAPAGYGMNYINSNASTNNLALDGYKFTTTRLSTKAIDPLSRSLLFGGVAGLLQLKSQQIPVIPVIPFDCYSPNSSQVINPTALDGTQVDFEGLYGEYFWEIFYHIPVLIADTLGTAQNFSYAKDWYTYIIDPSVKEKFIETDTFAKETQDLISTALSGEVLTALQEHKIGTPKAAIVNDKGEVNPQFTSEDDLSFLSSSPTSLSNDQIIMVRNVLLNYQLSAPNAHYWQFQPFRTHTLETLREILSDNNPAIAVYNDDPFDPHAIARLRIGAYEKYTLIQYIDNLIKWGDMLFTQDNWESITEATLMYVYAYDMLGPKPQMLGTCDSGQDATFADIKKKYGDNIPQFLIELENALPAPGSGQTLVDQGYNDLGTYFCVPDNSQLITYWETIEDRLYKIRHSMNIDGVVRQLALFQPPIDPLALAKAAAAGNNFMGYNGGQQAPLTPYRFQTMIQQARQVTGSAISLGNALLSALEKQDAAQLELLHNTQEKMLLDMNTTLKQNAIDQLQESIASNKTALASSQYQETYYSNLISKGLNSGEETNLSAMEAALVFNILGSVLKTAASIGYAVPQVGSPFAMTYGGQQIGNAINAGAGAAEIGSEISSYIAQRALTMAGYQRRSEDWENQKTLANYQSERLKSEIKALQIQIQTAQQELNINQKQISQNEDINNFLMSKFTNQQLYGWMAGQISAVLYQTYILGLDLALKAQQAYQQELDKPTSFINFNYWDSLHKGLLSGEHLMQALDQMESSYLENHTRRLEIEKTISLAATNPEQFLKLKADGNCTFQLTEEMFDYDFPGHYMRKIKSISVSIPAIVGPYQNIHATLTQTYSAYVNDAQAHDAVLYLLKNRSGNKPSSGLVESSQVSSIALSRGVDDSGLFLLNLDDPRYLPFEEGGVVSDWTLSLPKETNWFDLDSISDVIIQIKYTAKEDGNLETYVKQQLAQYPYQGGIYYNLGQSFATQWLSFMNDHSDSKKQNFTFPINAQALDRFSNPKLTEVVLHLITAEEISLPTSSQFLSLVISSQTPADITTTNSIGQLSSLSLNTSQMQGNWQLIFDLDKMKADSNLSTLLKDGFLDPEKLLGVEMTYLYNGKIFT